MRRGPPGRRSGRHPDGPVAGGTGGARGRRQVDPGARESHQVEGGDQGVPGIARHLRAERSFPVRVRGPGGEGIRGLRPPRRAEPGPGRGVPGDPSARGRSAHQSVVSGELRSRDAGRRASFLRHRPHRSHGLLQRHLPELGDRRAPPDPRPGDDARHLRRTDRPQHRPSASRRVIRGVRIEGVPPARRLPCQPLRRPGPRMRAGRRVPVRPLPRGRGRRNVRRPLRGEHDRLRGELRGRPRRTGRRQAGAAGADSRTRGRRC